jgi:hypothetical protein
MNCILGLFHLIEKIPAAFWGVLIGSFFSLGGVIISNRSSDRRFREQQEHDRILKKEEREHSLRKEMYLEVAESIAFQTNVLGRLLDPKFTAEELSQEFFSRAPKVARALVVAGDEIAKHLLNVTNALSLAYLRLSAQRSELTTELTQIKTLESLIESSSNERNRMLELIKQINIDGVRDDRRWNILNDNFEFEQKRIQGWNAAIHSTRLDLYRKQINLLTSLQEEQRAISQLMIPALAAVKAELNLQFNAEEFLSMSEKSFDSQNQEISRLIAKAQGTIQTPDSTTNLEGSLS